MRWCTGRWLTRRRSESDRRELVHERRGLRVLGDVARVDDRDRGSELIRSVTSASASQRPAVTEARAVDAAEAVFLDLAATSRVARRRPGMAASAIAG
jgi:hypothetical protein